MVKNLPANSGDGGSIPGPERSLGEGNDSPLQYSCLGNPMDREAWWAIVHRVAKRVGQDLATKQKQLKYQRNISCKDGHNKRQKWQGPNRSRRD